MESQEYQQFQINLYKQYLLANGDWNSVLNTKCPEPNIFIESIVQFKDKPYDLLPISRASFSKYVNTIFATLLIGKPHQAGPSKYLLHGYGYRLCSYCKNILPLSKFYVSNNNWDKLRNDCKSCEAKEAILPQNKEDILRKAATYRINNKAKIKEDRKNNSQTINCYTATRRARIKNQLGDGYILSEEVRYRKICVYLSKRYNEQYELDHFIPISMGGLHEPSNWQIITKQENLCKNKTLPEIFYSSNKGKWFIENKIGIRIKISSINS